VSVTAAQALAKCAATKTWTPDMCGQFCASMYGFGSSGYATALVQWNSIPAKDKHPGDANAPAGMLLFWGIGQGHVAISDGAGGAWSIDISGAGTVTRVPAGLITSRWGKPYLGWSTPVFQGIEWTGTITINGVDVSGYQPVGFGTTGLDFAIIKVTEGVTYTNPNWVGQRETARKAGLVTGFYHFGRPGNQADQAAFFLSKLSLVSGDFLAFDWEDTGVSCAQKDAWIKYVQDRVPGHRVILYCNKEYWLNRDTTSFAGDGLWIADYEGAAGSPKIQSAWKFHQWTDQPLDRNVANFANRAALKAWATPEVPDMPLTAAEITAIANASAKATLAYPVQSAVPPNAVHSLAVYIAYLDDHFAKEMTQLAALSTKSDAIAKQAADLRVVLADLAVKAEALAEVLTVPDGILDKLREAFATVKIEITAPDPTPEA
jgi:hypothetical protein